jgi:putative nucleotidyltransferase with HDIG domain
LALGKNNLRRLLLTFEALADLGPTLTGESNFPQTAYSMLRATLDAVGAREGVLFAFSDKPAVLRSVAVHGFAAVPDPAFIPLLPKHVHGLATTRKPLRLDEQQNWEAFLSLNGNVAPNLFHCLAPLTLRSRLVGVIALGRAQESNLYDEEALEVLALLAHYVAIAVQNHLLTDTLEQRVSENLKLLASVNSFYDQALEAFAAAIDIKHVNIHGHSMRVGRYSAAIAEAMGLEPTEIAGLRAAGYLHDIGKVAVDKRLFGKTERLDEQEFREIADHTVIGHRIVSGVQFPWAHVPEVVRSHHERADASGYPDGLSLNEMPLPARIVAVADTFDAMTSVRPWRQSMSVGEVLSELVRIAPQKYDPAAVQALLVQVRRDAVDPTRSRFLDEHIECNIAPTDIDHLASTLHHRLTQGRIYSA